jgi:hypothetical protein
MLDVAATIADDWRPVPFREFIIKIHSRCDLACDHRHRRLASGRGSYNAVTVGLRR